MRRGIPIHPVYCKLSYTISHTISYTISHTIFISQMFILFFFCLLTLASGCSGKPEQWYSCHVQILCLSSRRSSDSSLSSRRDLELQEGPNKNRFVHDIRLLIRWLFVGCHHFDMQVRILRNRMRVNMMSQNQFHLVWWGSLTVVGMAYSYV